MFILTQSPIGGAHLSFLTLALETAADLKFEDNTLIAIADLSMDYT